MIIIDLKYEEERDCLMIDMILMKSNKILRYIFTKY